MIDRLHETPQKWLQKVITFKVSFIKLIPNVDVR